MTELVTFEEHGEVLAHWNELGFESRTILCFDRHLDFKRIRAAQVRRLTAAVSRREPLANLHRRFPYDDDDTTCYGLDNFLYAAAVSGHVAKLVWVIPGEAGPGRTSRILWDSLSLVPGIGQQVLDTFCSTATTALAHTGLMELEATTLDGDISAKTVVGAHVDFDLDFFFDDDGTELATVDQAVDMLGGLELRDTAPTITYSTSSGFLPAQCRWVGPALAAALGHDAPVRCPVLRTPRTMDCISGRADVRSVDLNQLFSEELAPLRGAGESLRGVLSALRGDYDGAERSYHAARALGDRAHVAAYQAGLALMREKRYSDANAWLSRLHGDEIADSIQTHAFTLRAVCLAHVRDWASALRVSLIGAQTVPMRAENYRIAELCARSLGDSVLASSLRDRGASVTQSRLR